MNKKVSAAYLIFMLALTFVSLPGLFDAVLLPRQIFLNIFLIFLFLLPVSRNSFPAPGILFLLMTGLLCSSVISATLSMSATESFAVISRQIVLLAFFWLTAGYLQSGIITSDRLITAAMAFGLMAIVAAIINLYIKTALGIGLFRTVQEVYATFGNKNLLSSALFFCVPFFCMGWRISARHRVLAITGLLMIIGILVIIRTRAVFLALAAYVVIILYYYLRRDRQIKHKQIVISMLSLTALAGVGYQLFLSKWISSLTTSQNQKRQYLWRLFSSGTFKSRIELWKNSFSMIGEHPVLGVGPGNWQIYFPKYGLSLNSRNGFETGLANVQRPHNDFFWIFCENGIPGIIIYCALFFIAGLLLIRSLRKDFNWRKVFLLAGICSYAINSFFDFPYERIEHQVLLVLLLALTAHYAGDPEKSPIKLPFIHRWAITVILGAVLIFSCVRLNGLHHAQLASRACKDADWEAAISESEIASKNFCMIDPLSMPMSWYAGAALFEQRRFPASLEQFSKAERVMPYNIRVLQDLATVHEKTGNHKLAIEYYLQALKICPGFDEARTNLAASYFNSGQFGKAFEAIDRVNIHCVLPAYKVFLPPIVEKKINALLRNASPKTIAYWQGRLKTPEDLIQLYFESKQNSDTFTTYILKTNLVHL